MCNWWVVFFEIFVCFFFFNKFTLTPEVKKLFFRGLHIKFSLFSLITKGKARDSRGGGSGCSWLWRAQGELAGLMVGLLASERL